MKTILSFVMKPWLLGLMVCLSPMVANAACTTTLNPGDNVTATVAAASAGSTICLNSGAYGDQGQLLSVTKSPRVTIQSVTPLGATMQWWFYSNVNGITVDGISFTHQGQAQCLTCTRHDF